MMIMLIFDREGPIDWMLILIQFKRGALLLMLDSVLLLVLNGDDVAILWYDDIVFMDLFAMFYCRCDLLN